MRLKIYKYKALFNPYMLKPHNRTAWLLENDWNILLGSYPQIQEGKDIIYAKIECSDSWNHFIIYTQIAKLPSSSLYTDVGNGYIWLAEEVMPKDDITSSKKSEVDISILEDIESLPVAESMVIQLKEEDVEKWDEEEFMKAERNFREDIKLCNQQEQFFFHCGTKDAVVASIQKVIPSVDTISSPFRIETDTEIEIIGKPVDLKKVIDFSKIGGQKKVIDELRRIIQLPMNYPDYFSKFEIMPPKGVLLYGPPGNGKTMIARAVAQSFGAAFIEIDLSDALQKYKGVGEHNLDKKFEEAGKKRNAVIFIDEIDAIAAIRTIDKEGHEISLVGKLLSLMDGIKSNHRVFVIGATNRIDAIDPALRRPHRFDKDLEVPQPDEDGRFDILTKYIKIEKKYLYDDDIDENYIRKLAGKTAGYSGADLSALYTEAVMSAINKQLVIDENGKATMTKPVEEVIISEEDFEHALKSIKTTSQRTHGGVSKY